jgi:hypothetical protein
MEIQMLTTEQMAVLKADILAATDQATVDARTNGQTTVLASIYNQEASPAFYVWRSTFSPEQARAAISGGDALAQLDNLDAGKRDSLLWLFEGVTHPENEAQRNAIQGLCGTQNTLKAAILAAQKRAVTRAERLFATGTGSDASPGTLGWEGFLSADDIASALGG